jgi:hypothetical protein
MGFSQNRMPISQVLYSIFDIGAQESLAYGFDMIHYRHAVNFMPCAQQGASER